MWIRKSNFFCVDELKKGLQTVILISAATVFRYNYWHIDWQTVVNKPTKNSFTHCPV
jgi:hypothetical protein